MTRKTKLEIIEETKNYYSEDPKRRATICVDTGDNEYETRCKYLTEDGRMCAVGRCEVNPPLNITADVFTRMETDSVLFKPEYEGHSHKFWNQLQWFHDEPDYWDENGMTEKGQWKYDHLKQFWKDS